MVPIVSQQDVEMWCKNPTLNAKSHLKSFPKVLDVVRNFELMDHQHNGSMQPFYCAVSAHPLPQGEGVAVGSFVSCRTNNITLSDPQLWKQSDMVELSEHIHIFPHIQKALPSWRSDILERAITFAQHMKDGEMVAHAHDVVDLTQGQGFAVYDFMGGGYLKVAENNYDRGSCEPLFNASIFATKSQAQLALSKFGYLGRQYALVPVDLRIMPNQYEMIQSSGIQPYPLTDVERETFERIQTVACAQQLEEQVPIRGMDGPKKKM